LKKTYLLFRSRCDDRLRVNVLQPSFLCQWRRACAVIARATSFTGFLRFAQNFP